MCWLSLSARSCNASSKPRATRRSQPSRGPSIRRRPGGPSRVLTFRKGTAGTPTAAQAMADHLSEQTLPEEMLDMAEYYLRGVRRAEAEGTAAMPRQDMPLAVAGALGIDLNRTLTKAEVVNLLRGTRTDGAPIAGK